MPRLKRIFPAGGLASRSTSRDLAWAVGSLEGRQGLVLPGAHGAHIAIYPMRAIRAGHLLGPCEGGRGSGASKLRPCLTVGSREGRQGRAKPKSTSSSDNHFVVAAHVVARATSSPAHVVACPPLPASSSAHVASRACRRRCPPPDREGQKFARAPGWASRWRPTRWCCPFRAPPRTRPPRSGRRAR